MKPIHFRPNSDASANHQAGQRTHEPNSGPGVAAIVRSATSIEQPGTIERQRRVQLDDYVTRIRQTAKDSCQTGQPEVTFKTRIQDETPTAAPAFEAQHSPVASHTPTASYERIDTEQAFESSPPTSEVIQDFNDTFHQLRAPHVPTEQFSPEGHQTEEHRRLDAAYQRELIDDISVAIASTVSDVSDEQIKKKLPPAELADATSMELPVDVAAWDVEDFLWPTLSNQMIATASDAMQQLFDHVLNVSNEDGTRPSNRLAVTGSDRGEGTSTIAISIARWAAACGKSVLLVDADLTSPSLTTQVGLQHGLSWLKGVERNDNPAEVIIRSQRTNLCVMPLAPIGARSEHPRHLFDSLAPFLGKIESHFDWVVMDFGPGSQLLAELNRPELLIDSALLIGSDPSSDGLNSLQRRLQSLGLERFVLAQNAVQQREAA